MEQLMLRPTFSLRKIPTSKNFICEQMEIWNGFLWCLNCNQWCKEKSDKLYYHIARNGIEYVFYLWMWYYCISSGMSKSKHWIEIILLWMYISL